MADRENSVHGESSTTDRAAARQLQRSAIEVDAASVQLVELADIWRDLVTGESAIVDHFSTDDRLFLLLEGVPSKPDCRRLRQRQLDMLERLLLGQAQKVVAIEQSVSSSTVTSTLTSTLRAIGLNVSASRAPLLLTLLAHAHRGQTPIRLGRSSYVHHLGQVLRVVSTPQLQPRTCSKLSPAESEVMRLRVEGRSYAEIAALRRASIRTVANQLASAFRKLGVSGRLELLGYLSRGATFPPEASTEPRPPEGMPIVGAMPHLDAAPMPQH